MNKPSSIIKKEDCHLQTALESLTLEKAHEPGGEAALQDVFPAFQQEEQKERKARKQAVSVN